MKNLSSNIIETITKNLVERFHPEKIILFGSYAWGDPDESSDIDLMVIIPDSSISPARRSQLAHKCLRDIGIAKDIIVKTRKEFDKYSNVHASLECEVMERGRVLYG